MKASNGCGYLEALNPVLYMYVVLCPWVWNIHGCIRRQFHHCHGDEAIYCHHILLYLMICYKLFMWWISCSSSSLGPRWQWDCRQWYQHPLLELKQRNLPDLSLHIAIFCIYKSALVKIIEFWKIWEIFLMLIIQALSGAHFINIVLL